MPKTIGNISLYMGPQELGGPDDLQQTIVNFIDRAEKRLYIAVQELDNRAIAEAIVRARQRKLLVKVVLEADYLRAKRAAAKPFRASGEHEINRELHDALLRANIKVNSDYNPSIFHQKFIIRDSTSVLTGSTNFTDTGTSENLNHLVIVHDKKLARIYTREFTEIQQGHFGKRNEGHDAVPPEIEVSGLRVKALFAPDHNPEMEVMKQIAKARERVDFAIFTFAASSGIDDQLVLARQAGINVRGALFRSQANQSWSAKDTLRNADVDLFVIPRDNCDPPVNKLHHKLMVIDEQLVIAGSFNYTGPANRLNDENILILGDLDTQDAEAKQKQQELAGYALEEIDRIIQQFGARLAAGRILRR